MMNVNPGRNKPDLLQRFTEILTDICILGILWLICSLPIVTIGAANTAMYTVFMARIKQGDKDRVKPFFTAFKQNFRKATLLWLAIYPLMALFGVNSIYYLLGSDSGAWNQAMGIAQLCMLALAIMISCYAFPLLALYNHSVKTTLLRSIRYAYIHWPWTLLAFAISVAVPAIASIGLWHFAFLFAGIIGYANSRIMVKVLPLGITGDSL